jgi:hypothetical protein
MIRNFFVILLTAAASLGLGIGSALGQATNLPPWEPITNYQEQRVEGWRILVNNQLATNGALCPAVLKLLDAQLYQITRVVPAAPLAKLRMIPIWIENADPRFPCTVFHESADWLREHGVNPEKVNAVEISNPQNFLDWVRDQPWMMLHELTHGYHHVFLGDNQPDIRRCYQAAKVSGKYESILRIDGHHERHYAMTNEKEYFAEMTEAFFGTNDFFPFVRAELKEYDPEMYAVLGKLWETGDR